MRGNRVGKVWRVRESGGRPWGAQCGKPAGTLPHPGTRLPPPTSQPEPWVPPEPHVAASPDRTMAGCPHLYSSSVRSAAALPTIILTPYHPTATPPRCHPRGLGGQPGPAHSRHGPPASVGPHTCPTCSAAPLRAPHSQPAPGPRPARTSMAALTAVSEPRLKSVPGTLLLMVAGMTHMTMHSSS